MKEHEVRVGAMLREPRRRDEHRVARGLLSSDGGSPADCCAYGQREDTEGETHRNHLGGKRRIDVAGWRPDTILSSGPSGEVGVACRNCVRSVNPPSPRSRDESIADLPHREHVLWIRWVVLDAAPKLGDVRIDGSRGDERAVSPHLLEELPA